MKNFLEIIKNIILIIIKSIINYFKNIGIELFQWSKENIKEIGTFLLIILGIILLFIIPKIILTILGFGACTIFFLMGLVLLVLDNLDDYYRYPYLAYTFLAILTIFIISFYVLCMFAIFNLIW